MKGFGKFREQISGHMPTGHSKKVNIVIIGISSLILKFNVQTLRGHLFALSGVSVVSEQQLTLAYGHRTKKYGLRLRTQGEECHSATIRD